MKGKVEKKGAASKSLSSTKSPAKNMSESFKSKEFVSSDESSSAESKKEVGLLTGRGGSTGPFFPMLCLSLWEAAHSSHPGRGSGTLWYLLSVVCWSHPSAVGGLSATHIPVSPLSPRPRGGAQERRGNGSCCPDFIPCPQDSEEEGVASLPPSSEESASGSD